MPPLIAMPSLRGLSLRGRTLSHFAPFRKRKRLCCNAASPCAAILRRNQKNRRGEPAAAALRSIEAPRPAPP
ncbi:MAG: hypothetical protein AAGM38_01205 [Pseudomonadota bacterium]